MPNLQGYYRHPTIHGDTIIFVTEDDLWSVPATGGTARRLTATPGVCMFPVLSPDGSKVAFSGRDEGPLEIYVMDAQGGPPQRLTWLGGASTALGWSPDGAEILLASDWRRPFMKEQVLAAVPVQGGPVREFNLGPARAIAYEPDGDGRVIGRNSGDPARWKRYKGGTAGTIWIDRTGSGTFTELVKLAGNLANPMWIGKRIFFLSDHEGYANLYSCTPTGRDLRRHTHHEDFFVRFPSTDGHRIVYHAGADLFVFDPATGEENRIAITLQSPRAQRARRFVSPTRFFESFSLHPKGHSLASVHRGGVYAMGLWEGAPLRLGQADGPRYRLATWLPDGRHIVAVTDETGEESLVLLRAADEGTGDKAAGGRVPRGRTPRGRGRAAATRRGPVADGTAIGGVVRRIDGDFGRAVTLAVARHGADRVALANQRQELILVDLTTGKHRVIERSLHNRITGLDWSADGRWLAYGFSDGPRTTSIHLCEAATGKVTPITRSDFNDVLPVFDPEGRYLYFVSFRVFDPIYDSHYFDLGFPRGSRPYLVTLKRDAVSPFAAGTRPPRAPGTPAQDPNGGAEKKEEAKAPVRVEIDLDGIADRVVAFPVPEGIYADLAATKSRVFFSTVPAEGSLDLNWFATEPPARAALQAWNLDEDKLEPIAEKVTSFQLSLDAKVLAVRSGNRLRVLPSAFKADGKPTKDEPGRESGWVDLERLRVSVVPGNEWPQMFREIWRLQRDQFWTSDMSGIDWVATYHRYRPLVDRCGTRSEFSDLAWELQGELGTSHCYEVGGDYRPGPAWMQGFLGADVDYDRRRGAWKITRIPRGDSWDLKWSSPLAAPGLLVREGDEIVAVDGQPVGAEVSPFERLANQAGRDVRLTIRPGAGAGAARAARGEKAGQLRTVVVRTLNQEFNLRYRDWVERNRTWVHDASKGRVGYVHVPNMGPGGYAEFHRYYLSEVNRPGLLVDVRYNGGGHVSQLILEKLLRKRIGYDANRWAEPTPYPSDAPMGPMAALTNEYAGSDGDIFSHCFKLTGLGPLIGKRTWGGVVGIWPRHILVDGSLTSQPEFAFWFQDVAWAVENYGTDPDIEVEIRPQDWAAGLDPQLARGVVEVEKLIGRMNPTAPQPNNPPKHNPGGPPGVKKSLARAWLGVSLARLGTRVLASFLPRG